MDERDCPQSKRSRSRREKVFGKIAPVRYQLVLRHQLQGDGTSPKYIGTYTPKSFDTAKRNDELPYELTNLYSQVWWMVQEVQGQDGGEPSYDENDFTSSPFARHLVKCCQDMTRALEVREWCAENVKVQVQKLR